jgi:hypothetical protein
MEVVMLLCDQHASQPVMMHVHFPGISFSAANRISGPPEHFFPTGFFLYFFITRTGRSYNYV